MFTAAYISTPYSMKIATQGLTDSQNLWKGQVAGLGNSLLNSELKQLVV
jgi:hypothetical protein